jgi:hypothetical protein
VALTWVPDLAGWHEPPADTCDRGAAERSSGIASTTGSLKLATSNRAAT